MRRLPPPPPPARSSGERSLLVGGVGVGGEGEQSVDCGAIWGDLVDRAFHRKTGQEGSVLDSRVQTRTRRTKATLRQKLSSGAVSAGIHGALVVAVALGAASAGRLTTEGVLDTTVVRVAEADEFRTEPRLPSVDLQGLVPSWASLALSSTSEESRSLTSPGFDPTGLSQASLADEAVVQLAAVELGSPEVRTVHPIRRVARATRKSEDATSPLWSLLHPGGGNIGPGGTTGEHGGTGMDGLIGGQGAGGAVGGPGGGLGVPGVGGTLAGPAGGVTIGGPGQGGIIANPQRGQGVGIGLTFGGPDGPVSVTIGGPGCVTPPARVTPGFQRSAL